eukprot:gnl/MRDRNA2_/MRDRNA2_115657_c0_seq1.p1 gnl/MRDRNA2_/MRDRNA2_115657_c0~~gnl/MRDRNA2_/MRDRNA2_115657_c0_seq1.p1  ORF type:complete len:198 (+),score=20.49 gnl/MRDRNA2_/MRDRNA2_115657_c0_seq1:90-683(+)
MPSSTLAVYISFSLLISSCATAAEQDHHVAVDAAGAAKDAKSGDHLMRRIQSHDHETIPIPSKEIHVAEEEESERTADELLELENEDELEVGNCAFSATASTGVPRTQGNTAQCSDVTLSPPMGQQYTWQQETLQYQSGIEDCKRVCAMCIPCKGFTEDTASTAKNCKFQKDTTPTTQASHLKFYTKTKHNGPCPGI